MKISEPNFYVQWHITDKCSQNCERCYLFQSEDFEKTDRRTELSLDVLELIVRDVLNAAKNLRANAAFVLTGGDPLLHPDFWSLLKSIGDSGEEFQIKTTIDILGNPFYIDQPTAVRLRENGVRKFQLSIDGLEDKHDILRKAGSYRETLKAARCLKEAGIRTTCMFTLSRYNASDLMDVMRVVAREGFDAFAFARFCRPEKWSIEEYRRQMFSPLEYKDLLIEVNKVHEELTVTHPKTRFVLKDHLWELLFYEKSLLKEKKEIEKSKKHKIVVGGCSIGISSVSILADGTVYACRRLKSPIGQVPGQKLIDLFIDSEILNNYRDLTQYKKCGTCPLLYVCRGCGAVAHGYSGSFFDPDPQCWKIVD